MIGTEKQQTAQKHVYVDTIEYNIHMLTQSYSHTYIRTSLQVYVQIYIYICTYVYIYICTVLYAHTYGRELHVHNGSHW